MAKARKRRLTDIELEKLRQMMQTAPQGRKPTIRQLARYFGVNQPSIVKSLDGWKGIRRGIPEPEPKKRLIQRDQESPVKIEGYTTKVDTPADL